MYVRLAFAVAAHVEADILLVDEVLAVGDADFQKRCLGMMGDVARGGRTVIFVSHNLTALRNLCGTGLLLANGQMIGHGKIDAILEQYASSSLSDRNTTILPVDRNRDKAARVLQISVVPNGRDETSPISVDSGFNINTRIEVREQGAEVAVFLSCFDATQTRVFSTASFFEARVHESRSEIGTHEFLCAIPPDLLNEGEYTLDIALVRNRSEVIFEEPTVLCFRVAAASSGIEGWNWPVLGVVRPKLAWSQRMLGGSVDA
jgi:lipopolysaccharide transport system ATP-binding protein